MPTLNTPLRLAPFERYMLVDDRPGYPMHIVTRLCFEGTLNAQRLEQALAATLPEHPLLTATLSPTNAWTTARPNLPIQWRATKTNPSDLRLEPMELQYHPGLRIYAHNDDTTSELIFQAHHACCDGLGLVDFIADLLQYYGLTGEAAWASPRRKVHLLQQRYTLGLTGRDRWRALCRQGRAIGSILRFLRRPARPLGTETSRPTPESPIFSFDTLRLASKESQALLQQSRALGVTLNDLLLSTLLLTLQELDSSTSNSPWLRLCIPVNFRQERHHSSPAANWVSLVFLTRHQQDVQSRMSLLQSIHHEMNRIKRKQEGLTFNLGLNLYHRLGLLASHCTVNHCRTSAVLSNLGVLIQNHPGLQPDGRIIIGDLTLTALDFLPPIRPLTRLSLGVFTYAQKLCLSFHYDATVLESSNLNQLQEIFLKCLRRWS